MPRLIWSPAALGDVSRLYRFLAEKDRDAAIRAAKAIRQGIQLLQRHPQAGRPVDGLAPEFREWPLEFGNSGYVALYRLDDSMLIILAVRHAREVGYW